MLFERRQVTHNQPLQPGMRKRLFFTSRVHPKNWGATALIFAVLIVVDIPPKQLEAVERVGSINITYLVFQLRKRNSIRGFVQSSVRRSVMIELKSEKRAFMRLQLWLCVRKWAWGGKGYVWGLHVPAHPSATMFILWPRVTCFPPSTCTAFPFRTLSQPVTVSSVWPFSF